MFFLGTVLLISCNELDKLNETPMTIEARYMQYACGDWNDDMQILKVTDTTYNFLLGKDVDTEFLNGESEISEWFFNNETKEFGMSFQIKGYISTCAISGCEDKAPKFWITDIKKLNGEKFHITREN